MNKTFSTKKRGTALRGFTLVEMAIVMIIFSLLIGGMLMTLSSQQDIANTKETEKRLNDVRDALLGFAAANGRLPCPASPGTTGVENPVGGGACANAWNGFLPGITLGIATTDAQGYAVDGWGNRIRYATTTQNTNAFTFTTSNGMKNAWTAGLLPDLHICNSSLGITAATPETATCAAGAELTTEAILILFSMGKNGSTAPTGADEQANNGSNRTFVSHTPTPIGAPQGEFDDIVLWLSPNILYNRMITAGRLP